jgi:hypothetical protein
MQESITINNDEFFRQEGIETCHVYGGPGKYNFTVYTFLDKNFKSRKFTSSRDLVVGNLKDAIEEIKKILSRIN